MNAKSHRALTRFAFKLLEEKRICGHTLLHEDRFREGIISRNSDTDKFNDVEFVDVWYGRDNPHVDEWDAIDDETHHSFLDNNFTAYNHFIDIKKGPGLFDDYDGYSYAKGSAHRDQYETAAEVADHQGYDVASWFLNELDPNAKFDEAMMWWFNDEYVHAPCHKWYRGCSPAVERYSYFQDKNIYSDKNAELAARFPMADHTGEVGKGIPYSVFMPVDNLARYWYEQFINRAAPIYLGSVLHGIQDACVPQHAAGYVGNGHSLYESRQETHYVQWFQTDQEIPSAYWEPVIELVQQWNHIDPTPPLWIDRNFKQLKPAKNWRVDQMVTWLAWNAYDAYANVYNNFKGQWSLDAENFQTLTQQALAMTVLVMIKGHEEAGLKACVGNRATKELHLPDCKRGATISLLNRIWPLTLQEGLRSGFNGCHYCMDNYDTE